MYSRKLANICSALIILCLLVKVLKCEVGLKTENETTTEQVPTRYTKDVCPPAKMITGVKGGRLGNAIWEYTSVIALSIYLPGNYSPYSNEYISTRMDAVFDNVDLPLTEDIPKFCNCCANYNFSAPNLNKSKFITIEAATSFKSENNISVLSPYAILIEHVMKQIDVIKKRLPYKQQFIDHANKVFSVAKTKFLSTHPHVKVENITFVGCHVRRTDFLKAITDLLKKKTVGAKFFLRSFDYFRQRKDLGRPVFLIVSDDTEWVRTNLYSNQSDVFLVSRGDIEHPGNDIVLLSLCNHTIIDYGSYGFWASIYSGGEVISTKISHSNVVTALSKYPNWHFVDVDDEGDFYLPLQPRFSNKQ